MSTHALIAAVGALAPLLEVSNHLTTNNQRRKPMKEFEIGDILPAREAILLLDEADLTPPIEVPAIPAENEDGGISDTEREWLHKEIRRLKKERNALILAHNYMTKDIQDAADFVGGSLNLAQKGRESDADVLVECAVLFMNQILAIMKKPGQTVLAPDLGALCSLAASADVEKIRAWKREHPDGIVISYVNTYIDVKAESDYCCASANAEKVLLYVLEHEKGKPILFLPDVYLGFYAAKLLEKRGVPLDLLWLMMGACHVHDRIRPHHVAEQMKFHPEAAVVVHPECGCTSACMRQMDGGSVPANMLGFRSTQGMAEFIKNSPASTIIMATEVDNAYPMSKAVPGKIIIPASREARCAFMKQNTLRNLYLSLRDMKHEITVDKELARRARLPIERMLAIR